MQRRHRIWEIIESGSAEDIVSRCYDVFTTLMTIVNVSVTVLYTFDEMELKYGTTLLFWEAVTVAFFAMEYGLRIWTSQFTYPNLSNGSAIKKYALSFSGFIDLLSFLPYYLPVFFPSGAAVFRMFRVIRIFRSMPIMIRSMSLRKLFPVNGSSCSLLYLPSDFLCLHPVCVCILWSMMHSRKCFPTHFPVCGGRFLRC